MTAFLTRRALFCFILCVFTFQATLVSSKKKGVKWAPDLVFKYNRSVKGFTTQEKQDILNRHNKLRRKLQASNMMKMEWDFQLELLAKWWARQCNSFHNPNRKTSMGKAGENIAVKPGGYSGVWAVQAWYNENQFYDYDSNTCEEGERCGHFTQVVWHDSYKVGCGINYCQKVKNAGYKNAYIIVCNYIKVGNFVGQKPYKKGTPCSHCPKGKSVCDEGLCRAGTQLSSRTKSKDKKSRKVKRKKKIRHQSTREKSGRSRHRKRERSRHRKQERSRHRKQERSRHKKPVRSRHKKKSRDDKREKNRSTTSEKEERRTRHRNTRRRKKQRKRTRNRNSDDRFYA